MEHSMTLHNNAKDFAELIRLTAEQFNILPAYVEKDYWITLILNRLSHSTNSEQVVFKGGTSLSKGYRLINRFSEDIDIATINENLSGNALKTKIRTIEKEITVDVTELVEPKLTSKGSMYRKSVFEYPSVILGLTDNTPKRIIVEINSFANPYPFVKQEITSFITDFLTATNQQETAEQYDLQPFVLSVLDKRRTMLEKLVSLIRFSFAENPTVALAAKIRHFYDLYYLANDAESVQYIQSSEFQNDLAELLAHDQLMFETPAVWRDKTVKESPLVNNFPALWESLRTIYQMELVTLAFSEIPNETIIYDNFINKILKWINA
jgi:predicted nucleotidyltransferase component of viral defense system